MIRFRKKKWVKEVCLSYLPNIVDTIYYNEKGQVSFRAEKFGTVLPKNAPVYDKLKTSIKNNTGGKFKYKEIVKDVPDIFNTLYKDALSDMKVYTIRLVVDGEGKNVDIATFNSSYFINSVRDKELFENLIANAIPMTSGEFINKFVMDCDPKLFDVEFAHVDIDTLLLKFLKTKNYGKIENLHKVFKLIKNQEAKEFFTDDFKCYNAITELDKYIEDGCKYLLFGSYASQMNPSIYSKVFNLFKHYVDNDKHKLLSTDFILNTIAYSNPQADKMLLLIGKILAGRQVLLYEEVTKSSLAVEFPTFNSDVFGHYHLKKIT